MFLLVHIRFNVREGRRPAKTRRGTDWRELPTQYGGMPNLHMPQLRRGHGHLTWQTITRYGRCWGPLLDQQRVVFQKWRATAIDVTLSLMLMYPKARREVHDMYRGPMPSLSQ